MGSIIVFTDMGKARKMEERHNIPALDLISINGFYRLHIFLYLYKSKGGECNLACNYCINLDVLVKKNEPLQVQRRDLHSMNWPRFLSGSTLQSSFLAAEQFLKKRQLVHVRMLSASSRTPWAIFLICFCDASMFLPSTASKKTIIRVYGLSSLIITNNNYE